MRHGSRRSNADDTSSGIRQMVARIAAQREAATYSAATAIVNTGQVQQALATQRLQLEGARTELAGAVELAQRVADDVLAQDGAMAALPYQLNVDGLQSQDSVLEAAIRQIDGLREATSGQVDTARTLLRNATRSLDEALREQLRLLIAVERLEYQRVVLEARARARAGLPDRLRADREPPDRDK